MATAWKERRDRGEESRSHFVYVETGSFMGLSTQIVTTTALSVDIPVISYAHDLFDSSTTELWDAAPQERTNLQNFYDNVRKNGLVSNIVPIIGKCSDVTTSLRMALLTTVLCCTATQANPGRPCRYTKTTAWIWCSSTATTPTKVRTPYLHCALVE